MVNTNSPIGSSHWFRTLVGNMKSIGDFMKDAIPSTKQRVTWGNQISEYSNHLLEHHGKINIDWKESNQKKRNRVYIRSKSK